MSSQLDPSILAAITAEARQCFLDEDAPEYLQMLEEGLQDREHPEFTALLRAAHSLKGGAGLASLTSLQKLAHKLEDVLVGIQQGQITELDLAWALVEKGIEEVGFILSQARTVDNAIANPELITALETLAESISTPETAESEDSKNNSFVHTALTVDLETIFAAIEELKDDLPVECIQELLANFVDECRFLAETLELPWLIEAITTISDLLGQSPPIEVLVLTKEIINHLRFQRDQYLNNSLANEVIPSQGEQSSNDNLVADTLNQDLEKSCQAIAELPLNTPESLIPQLLSGFADECTFLGETLNLPWLVEAVAPIETLVAESEPLEALLVVQELVTLIREQRDLYLTEAADIPESGTVELLADLLPPLTTETIPVSRQPKKEAVSQIRIPLQRLEGMTTNVEELILSQARLSRQQQLLNQANYRLRLITRQFEPIRDQVQTLYDQLAVGSTNISNRSSLSNSQGADKNLSQVEESNTTFDSLELDHYTELHTSLQSFQELMLQIQETRTDLDLVDRELSEDLEQTQKNLDLLYSNVTDSRLVPFNLLAQRFVPQIRGLNERFDKAVNLEIKGENTLLDQVLLEQLQTPLTHLLNNAFDHGIESKAERFASQKPEAAQIVLTAKIENNLLAIIIQDDGSGINLEKVYARALERGICPCDQSIDKFSPAEIVDWIFEPNFSTAAQVSDISGRGMGLDIVRSQIRKLRGQLQVQTTSGQGSTFTIKLPLNLSLRSLLLVQLQNRIIAIPNNSIIETLPYSELNFTDSQEQAINWHQKTIPVHAVSNLLPCPRQPFGIDRPKVGMVLETAFGASVILVDALLREEKLIVKPFDDTVPVPTYLAGCTVLGTGEVIPVILPQGFERDSVAASSGKSEKSPIFATKSVSTILVAEDSVATRRMLEKLLTAVGYQVIVCRDGQEALERIEQDKGEIDLILSDVEMPRLNGFELLRKVRAIATFRDTPMVMATSRTGDLHKQEAIRLGATDYLGKPIQPQELLNTVEALLSRGNA
jgi:chemotaxis protein histidine kinase CheA/ActR/RegA family two-component response regulator